MTSLKELKQFIEREEVKNNPYWRSILSSDTRNIFPKYQLSKIQIAKNKVAKMRLVMENLSTFLSLQIYAQSIDNVTKSTPQKQIRKEILELQRDILKCREDRNPNDYDFEILEGKGKVELLCQQLSKPKIEEQIKQMLQKTTKWKQYLDNYCKIPAKFDPILNQRDKANLSFNISLKSVEDCLINGTSARIIEQRTKDQIIKHRLKQIFASDNLQLTFPAQNDPFSRQWQEYDKILNEDIA